MQASMARCSALRSPFLGGRFAQKVRVTAIGACSALAHLAAVLRLIWCATPVSPTNHSIGRIPA